MVGILLKIGKQSENVGEEEVFGRFCIRDVTENPSGGLLRRADIRPPESGFCPRYGIWTLPRDFAIRQFFSL